MRVIEHQQLSSTQNRRSVVTIGKFDGVHLGHVQLLKRVVERARALNAVPAAYTFEPHPLKVLVPHRSTPMISTFDERLRRIEAAGISLAVWARFTREYASLDPRDFVRFTLKACLGAVEIWIGPDFAFGRDKNGTIDLLRQEGARGGFSVHVIDPLTIEGGVVSSTRIRQAVATADFRTAGRMLGRPYSINGSVVPARGRNGIPDSCKRTMSVQQELLPPPGLYSAWAVNRANVIRSVAVTIAKPISEGRKNEASIFSLDRSGELAPVEMEIRFQQRLDLSRAVDRPLRRLSPPLLPGLAYNGLGPIPCADLCCG
jgi:riboflavin kinase/FMN adenylyltransferase